MTGTVRPRERGVTVLTIVQLRANVALSRVHVAKQEGIIARLIGQGHDALATSAKGYLVTMNAHLAAEEDMLARAERERGGD